MKLSSIRFTAIIALLFLVLTGSAWGKQDPIYTTKYSDVAAGGYDVTEYFTSAKPVKGKATFKTEYNGAKWHFASQQNLDKFVSNPQKYAPQYGGYCAWAVAAKNKLYSGDPLQWTVHDDKLYLNYNAKISSKWRQDKEQFIVVGDKNWPSALN